MSELDKALEWASNLYGLGVAPHLTNEELEYVQTLADAARMVNRVEARTCEWVEDDDGFVRNGCPTPLIGHVKEHLWTVQRIGEYTVFCPGCGRRVEV